MTDEECLQKIEAALDQIRPNIQMDGGDIHFVKFQDGIVYIKLSGACVGCPAAIYTLKLGVEQAIKEHVPDVIEVVAVDDE
jgi:Fe-S cluster biogenesis protein NfuA